MTKVDFARSALEYAKIGWRTFPLAPGTKMPAIKGGHGVKEATNYEDDLIAWGRKFPGANIGLACGAQSGIVVVDIDPRHNGHTVLAQYGARGQILPPGPRARTGNGGYHHFFRHQVGITNSKNRLGPGIDIKSTGGYVVAAPSWIAKTKDGDGGFYQWEVSPFEVAIPRLPVWLAVLLSPPKRPQMAANHSPGRIGSGSLGGLMRFVDRAADGTRNNSLYWAACRAAESVQRHEVSAQEAERDLLRHAVAVRLSEKEALATIRSAFQMIMQKGK